MAFGQSGDFETAKLTADANGLLVDFLYSVGAVKNSITVLKNAVNGLKQTWEKYRYLSISIGGQNCDNFEKEENRLILAAAQSVFNKKPLKVEVSYGMKRSREFAERIYNRLPAFTIPMQIYFSNCQCEQVNFNPFKGYCYEF